jgi:hypothetical protein
MSDTSNAEYEQQYAEYRQQTKQDLDRYMSDFEQVAQQGSLDEIAQWKDHFEQLAQGYYEAASTDPNPDMQAMWNTAAENIQWAAQTLSGIADVDPSGFADTLRNAQGSMQNLSSERDDEDEEKKSSLRDHRQKANETMTRLEQMSSSASDIKRMSRNDVMQLRNDMYDLHQNTSSTSSDHRNADEQAGQDYDSALEYMSSANQWGDALGEQFDQTDSVVDALRAASEALGQMAR